VTVARTTPTKVVKYAYFTCFSVPVNALRLVVGFLLQVGYKQDGRIIPKVSDCLIQLDVHSNGYSVRHSDAAPFTVSAPETAPVAPEVTANERFYRVDVNVTPPAVDVDTWKLSLHGLVSNQLSISYAELKSMQAVDQYNTLECVSNLVGDDLISNALWKGIGLKDLLGKAQVKPEAVYVVFTCADGYDVGIPMERALLDGTILVYEMNGVPLPMEHGRPVRAIVPGLYGMMNAKWVTDIEVVDKVHQGFWQRRGWTNDARYQTESTIAIPGDSPVRDRFVELGVATVLVGSKAPIVGIAFAGDRGILKVEVSTDGGNTWETASVKDPLSGYTWVFWAAEWNPPTKGDYRIIVRATDKTGKVQTAILQDPFPNGATGYHMVDITVETTVSH
jgi:DMSO/TMAO reductase YedYZ molybdopterin-dependent catalytic subunit